MPVVHKINKTKIVIYNNDHGIPHAHVIHPDYEAKIAIEDGTLIEGHAPKNILKDAKDWIAANKGALMQKWNATR